jgi:hypothetical protein
MVTIGTAIALWCVFTFVFIGKGTPAPFDPPRKLVIRGPYRFVRNPMLYRRRNDPGRRGAFLPVVVDLDLCGRVSCRDAPVRSLVRGADSAANVRRGIQSVLQPGEPMVGLEKG